VTNTCDTCSKPFARKDNLAVHMKIHTGDKPFSCDTCRKSGNLARHMKGHTDDKSAR
jgi:KRAB domain-containing zinc finger protein